MTGRPLLEVEGLHVRYPTRGGVAHAVAGVDLQLRAGEILGVVGESGCGKSTMVNAILQSPKPKVGRVFFDGQELTALTSEAVRRLRPQMQMVFQDPVSSLNPRRTVRQIVAEPLNIWRIGDRQSRRARVDEMLIAVGLNPDEYGHRRPSELSGGQSQRVAIARALVGGARLLICDEPVSSLDVSLRATVLNLIEDLRSQYDLAVVFVAHDLAVVRNISDRVMVMYLGRVVEVGDGETLFSQPGHPYTRALLSSIPYPDPNATQEPLSSDGEPPSPLNPPSGCHFRTRCPLAQEICASTAPPLVDHGGGHQIACHFPEVPEGYDGPPPSAHQVLVADESAS